MKEIDYRRLLYKYMGVVIEESKTINGYLTEINNDGQHYSSYNHFSPEELKELYKISQEHEEKANFKGYG